LSDACAGSVLTSPAAFEEEVEEVVLDDEPFEEEDFQDEPFADASLDEGDFEDGLFADESLEDEDFEDERLADEPFAVAAFSPVDVAFAGDALAVEVFAGARATGAACPAVGSVGAACFCGPDARPPALPLPAFDVAAGASTAIAQPAISAATIARARVGPGRLELLLLFEGWCPSMTS